MGCLSFYCNHWHRNTRGHLVPPPSFVVALFGSAKKRRRGRPPRGPDSVWCLLHGRHCFLQRHLASRMRTIQYWRSSRSTCSWANDTQDVSVKFVIPSSLSTIAQISGPTRQQGYRRESHVSRFVSSLCLLTCGRKSNLVGRYDASTSPLLLTIAQSPVTTA